jgi:general stress protein YciG
MANTSKRGFASMDAAKQREIASKGGRAAHAKGTAHEFTSDEARIAGRKGGEAVSRDRAHMSAIGREGGHSRGARARAAAQSGTTSPQNFNRQVNEERSGFDTVGRAPVSASDRGSLNTNERSASGGSRSERSGDSAGNVERFSSRDEI